MQFTRLTKGPISMTKYSLSLFPFNSHKSYVKTISPDGHFIQHPLRLLKHVSKSKVPLHESSHTVIHTYKPKWIYFFEMRIFLLENILNRLRRSVFMKQNWKGESGQHDNHSDGVKIRNTAGHLYCSGCLQKRSQSLKIYFRYFFCWIQAGPTMSYAHVEACIHVDTVHICLTWCNAHNWIKLHIRKLSIS